MSKFQIDPKVQMFIAIVVGGLSFFATAALPDSISPTIAKNVHEYANLFNQFYIIVVTPLMLAYTNSNPGPLAPQDSPAVVKAQEKDNAVVVKDAKDIK